MAACHYCGEPKAKTEDHIAPKALGGTDIEEWEILNG